MLKKLFLLNIIFLTFCFSHQPENALLNISNIDEKTIKIEVLELRTKKEIFSNQVKIISLKNGEILDEFLLSKENQIINIPKEEYSILVKVGDNLIYKKDSFYEIFFILICSFIFIVSIIYYLLRIGKYSKI
ncbi:hypothetical protein [Arcobacter sp. s6]|jgi:hypothetical protein|uniref:hypothetical protein n=1 Tax=Arcobacter sp. s6 TaxID=3230363 RepID=UPI0034A00E01